MLLGGKCGKIGQFAFSFFFISASKMIVLRFKGNVLTKTVYFGPLYLVLQWNDLKFGVDRH